MWLNFGSPPCCASRNGFAAPWPRTSGLQVPTRAACTTTSSTSTQSSAVLCQDVRPNPSNVPDADEDIEPRNDDANVRDAAGLVPVPDVAPMSSEFVDMGSDSSHGSTPTSTHPPRPSRHQIRMPRASARPLPTDRGKRASPCLRTSKYPDGSRGGSMRSPREP